MSIAGWLFKGMALGICILAGCKIRRILLGAKDQYQKINQLDYIPPEPDAETVLRVSQTTIAWQVGPVEILGRENIEKFSPTDPLIVISNHSHYADTSVIVHAINRKTYWMAAIGVLKFAGGLSGYYLKDCGAVPMEIAGNREEKALWRFTQLLAAGKTLSMFPEGWIHLDGITQEFKKGVVHIAREAEALRGRPVHIVPIFISYGRYPGKLVSNLKVPFDYLFTLIAAPLYRAGATVCIGEAIPSSALPADTGEAVKMLRNRVVELNPKKNGKPAI
jgi:1-acyl-sn-glycerol-3-phosphate acyltransferase